MRKLLLVLMALVLMVSLVGCVEDTQPASNTTSFETASKLNEENARRIIESDDPLTIEKSLDRANLRRRAEFLNQADRIGYLYLLSDTGQLIREEQVLGKVTNLNSYLTPMEDVQWFRDVDLGEYHGDVAVVTSAPDIDGTYGSNSEGIFWFTPDNVYREWTMGGIAFYSSERLSFSSLPILVEMLNENKK